MISLELVPRDLEELVAEAKAAMGQFNQLDYINVPDVLRLSIHSWEAAEALLKEDIPAIPHLRAMDHTLAEYIEIIQPLMDLGLQKLILISGDAPADDADFQPSGETPITLTRGLKKAFPQLEVYGALDPYRTHFQDELAYAHAKIEAGMDGLFSQPFFDERLLGIYLDQLEGIPFYAGLSPVTTEKSIGYWERVNKVVFPAEFEATLDYNAQLGQRCLDLVAAHKQNAYLMPIRISAQEYLSALWGQN